MYIGVVKYIFEDSGVTDNDQRELASLVEKLRSRFKATIRIADDSRRNGEMAIIAVMLQPAESEVQREIDALALFCEQSGFARISGELIFLDHVDALWDESTFEVVEDE